MRKVLRPLIAATALVALTAPSLVGAANAARITTRHIAAQGGRFTWAVTIHSAKTCTWSSSPTIAGFNATVKCKMGMYTRSATIAANTSPKARYYTLSLTARGTATTVYYLRIAEAGASLWS